MPIVVCDTRGPIRSLTRGTSLSGTCLLGEGVRGAEGQHSLEIAENPELGACKGLASEQTLPG